MLTQSNVNCIEIENNLASFLCPKIIKQPEQLKHGSWGVELVAECSSKNMNLNSMYDLCNAIIKRINMTQIANTLVENNENFSLLSTLIAESHICLIYNKKTSTFFIDMFSCKYYEAEIVVDLLKNFNLNILSIKTSSRGLLHNES